MLLNKSVSQPIKYMHNDPITHLHFSGLTLIKAFLYFFCICMGSFIIPGNSVMQVTRAYCLSFKVIIIVGPDMLLHASPGFYHDHVFFFLFWFSQLRGLYQVHLYYLVRQAPVWHHNGYLTRWCLTIGPLILLLFCNRVRWETISIIWLDSISLF